ncbi:thioredoxin family protein [Candidatus Micrarchaeota archaeon]|nr:thioredoxin family protein [Candidatus Micrarchaeota archaeon]
MAVIQPDILDQLKTRFEKELNKPVKLILFGDESECPPCKELRILLEELSSINPKISAEFYSFKDPKSRDYSIEMAPAIFIEGEKKAHIVFYGIPGGHEFITFIEDIIDVSKGAPDIPQEVIEKIKQINFPVHIKVFVTPTCPHCSGSAKAAHDFAILNSNIKSDVIQANEFPALSQKYNVRGVPKTVINEIIDVVGAQPLDILADKILAMKK